MQNKLRLSMKVCSREEIEDARVDAHRFMMPEHYRTVKELNYFKDEFNRDIFRDYYWDGKKFRNKTLLAFVSISTLDVETKWTIGKPMNMMYYLHKANFVHLGKTFYNLQGNECCELYNQTFVQMEAEIYSGLIDFQTNLQEYFSEMLKKKMQKEGGDRNSFSKQKIKRVGR